MAMEREERLLARVEDAFGVISVYEVEDYRFLEFGDAIEQSCTFVADPSWLEYDYTRAMLVGALCHEQPESALFLGLGAGTLTQACLKYLPLEDVEAIELRPDVPRLAMEYMGLDDDPRLYVRVGMPLSCCPRRKRPTCCSSTCIPTPGLGSGTWLGASWRIARSSSTPVAGW